MRYSIITIRHFFKEAQKRVSKGKTKCKSRKTDGKKEEKQHEEFVNGVRHAVSRHPHVPFETSCIDSITSAASCRGGNTHSAYTEACSPAANQTLGARVTQPIRARQPHPYQPQRERTRERETSNSLPLEAQHSSSALIRVHLHEKNCLIFTFMHLKHIWFLNSWAVKHSHSLIISVA